ncbi:hypothetical protein AX14_011699 [Amanita brunnescens Koide BX004]|nr:hypothetical protein AX14_011699 [Amanita brunnescens Koide BX004]
MTRSSKRLPEDDSDTINEDEKGVFRYSGDMERNVSYLDDESLMLYKETPFDDGDVVDPVLLGSSSSWNVSLVEPVNLFREVFNIVALQQCMGERSLGHRIRKWGLGRGEESY